MASLSRSRIEVYENGRRAPIASRPPVLSASVLSGEGAILEKHVTPQAVDYLERISPTHLVFVSDSAPVRASCRLEGRHFSAQLHPGSLWITPRSVSYPAVFEGPHGGIVLSIGTSQFERHIGPLMLGGRLELGFQFNSRDNQLEHLIRALLAVVQDGSQADPIVADLIVSAICIRLAKRYAVSKLNVAPRRGGLSAVQLKRVLEYINANLDNNITLSTLADTANISLYYFATLFKKSTGLSPHRYVLLQRIRRAEQLLRDTQLSVLEVGLTLGFEHQGNFARAFRRVTGVSPTHFRHDHL